MLRWYLVHTKPSGEASAELNLKRQGFSVYFPRLAQTVRREGGLQERVAPLFPRYLFLQLDEGRQSLAPAHSTIGVSNIVRFGSRYASVPDEVVDELRSRADAKSGLHRMRRQSLSRGYVVKIATGPFEGLDAIFDREVGADRVVVLLTLLGRQTAVRIPTAAVLPAMAV